MIEYFERLKKKVGTVMVAKRNVYHGAYYFPKDTTFVIDKVEDHDLGANITFTNEEGTFGLIFRSYNQWACDWKTLK